MKMKPEHFEQLDLLITEFIETYSGGLIQLRAAIHSQATHLDKEMWFRWDLFHAAVPSEFAHELHEYLNDTHIDTALRHIVPCLGATQSYCGHHYQIEPAADPDRWVVVRTNDGPEVPYEHWPSEPLVSLWLGCRVTLKGRAEVGKFASALYEREV